MSARFVVVVLLLLTVFGLPSRAAAAPSVLAQLYQKCPNGMALHSLNVVNTAHQYQERVLQRAQREAARQFYHCSLAARDPHVQDWAQFYCMQNVGFSLSTSDEMLATSKPVMYVADIL